MILMSFAVLPLAARAEAAAGPSFNCRAAKTEAEKAVCSDAHLAELDGRLAKVWNSYLDAFDDDKLLAILHAEQAAWISRRNACRADGACIAGAYAERYGLLTGKHPRRQFAGVYRSSSGSMAVYPSSTGSYVVSIMTSDSKAGNWTCMAAGPASSSGNSLTVKSDGNSFTVLRDGGAMKIEPNEQVRAVERKDCGLNGTIAFTYARP
jgi:uncharacterized protein